MIRIVVRAVLGGLTAYGLAQTVPNGLDGLFAGAVIDVGPLPFWCLVVRQIPERNVRPGSHAEAGHIPSKLHPCLPNTSYGAIDEQSWCVA